MASGAVSKVVWWRLPVIFLALAVATTGISASFTRLALAQDADQRRPWLLRDLFSARKSGRVEPKAAVPQKQKARKKPAKKATVARSKPSQRQQQQVAKQVVVKAEDARVVLVIGDFLAGGLAEGLVDVFSENPRIRVVDRSNGSSGFVRQDYYNWPTKAVELIEKEKPAAVVVMLGANDRQEMRIDGNRELVASDGWKKEYTQRVDELAKAIAGTKVPYIWVGVPSFRQPKMMSDMLAFNDIYRAAAHDSGAEFVDIWDGFVDENGAYVSSGPDMNGQPVTLRSDDGINLTKAGGRKVAFYAEKPLFKLLGETGAPGASPAAPIASAAPAPAIDVSGIDRTQPMSLRDPELDGGGELLGLVPEPKRESRSPGEKLSIDGIAPDATPGRADDFSWPRATSTTTAAVPKQQPATGAPEQTTAIQP